MSIGPFDEQVLNILKHKSRRQTNGPMYLTALQIVHELGGVAGEGAGSYYTMANDVRRSCEKWEALGKVEVLRTPEGKTLFFHTKHLVLKTSDGATISFGNEGASLYRVKPHVMDEEDLSS